MRGSNPCPDVTRTTPEIPGDPDPGLLFEAPGAKAGKIAEDYHTWNNIAKRRLQVYDGVTALHDS